MLTNSINSKFIYINSSVREHFKLAIVHDFDVSKKERDRRETESKDTGLHISTCLYCGGLTDMINYVV